MIERKMTDIMSKLLMHFILLVFALLCLVPMILTISISLSDEQDLILNGYSLIPRIFSIDAYQFLFKNPAALITSYWVTIRTTFLGTFLGVLFMSMAAFSLSRKDFTWRKPIVFYIFFTMLFSGGLVPMYMVVTRTLHMQDTLLVLFMPIMINAWNTFLLVTYLRSISFEMIESAKLDGANEFTIYLRIIMPMAKPALAAIALLLSLRLWNEWYSALLYIRDPKLVPLQYWMQRVMNNMQFLLMNQDMMGGGASSISMADLPTQSVRMAMAVLAAGPMMFVFPFFQKYFAKGLLVGSIKG
jgi:putative aldouronate transport system permease protein